MPGVVSGYEAAALGGVAVLSAVFGWLRWGWPKWRHFLDQVKAVLVLLLGSEAEPANSITGAESTPAVPGVGVRLAEQEKHLGTIAESVAILAQSHVQIEAQAKVIANHEDRIGRLEGAAVERVVGKAESAAAWSAMEAVAKSTPPPDPEREEIHP